MYSYKDLVDKGISVCVSCGSANVNENYLLFSKNSCTHIDPEYCYDCKFQEGLDTCMTDDSFYQKAKITINQIKRGKL